VAPQLNTIPYFVVKIQLTHKTVLHMIYYHYEKATPYQFAAQAGIVGNPVSPVVESQSEIGS
jgi:hypothetical protein